MGDFTHPKPSVLAAKQYFEEHILPRRVRDYNAEQNYEKSHGEKKIIFRRVLPNEVGVGEPFPMWTAGLDTFATFGKGIGIYFMQLLVLSAVALISGMIMMIAANEYKKSNYGINEEDTDDQFLLISAACKPFTRINVTLGCSDGGSQCEINLREDCGLPTHAVYADLAMSLMFAAVIFASKYFENKIERNLDEAIQTVQDYSIVVQDPTSDADDPDEWYEFFSRFGKVRYVTVVRQNGNLVDLIVQKHELKLKAKSFQKHYKEHRQSQDRSSNQADKSEVKSDSEYSKSETNNSKKTSTVPFTDPSSIQRTTNKRINFHQQLLQTSSRYQLIHKKLSAIDIKIAEAIRQKYRVSKVFVTFEYEEHQRLCLQSLEVPDINAYFDCLDKSQGRKLFRGTNVLNVQEPPEADNILWQHLSYSSTTRMTRQFISWILTLAILAASWYLIKITNDISSAFLATVIGIVDAMLPSIFQALTKYTKPQSQSHLENSLQMKLFAARLMLSTILPYVQTPWNQVLDMDFIRQVSIVQVATCFTAPIIAFLDITGYIQRHWVGLWLSDTQEELNMKWSGNDWSLAERYTGIAKILFVSIYYALITPYSIFLSFIAFVLIFLIDRYLLLRKWKRVCMLDADVAIRLRQQALLAIATHMYITMRFIYSWPMDEAYWNDSLQMYEKVNKYPSITAMLGFTKGTTGDSYSTNSTSSSSGTTVIAGSGSAGSLDWQTSEQQHVFLMYKITFYFIACIVVIVWLLIPLYQYLHRTFCYTLDLVGDSQKVAFSDISQMTVYEPLITSHMKGGQEMTYLCSYTKEMLEQHRPPLLHMSGRRDKLDDRERRIRKNRYKKNSQGVWTEDYDDNDEDGDDESRRVDLSDYITEEQQKHLLSIVKYYGDEMIELGLNPNGVNNGEERDESKESRIISIAESKPGRGKQERGYEIKTTHDGVLTRVPESTIPSLHPELFMLIQPRVVELGNDRSIVPPAVAPGKSSSSSAQNQSQFAPKKASFAKEKRAQQREAKQQKELAREVKHNVSSNPNRQFTAKPLYQQLYGVSSSSSGSDSEYGDDFIIRMSKGNTAASSGKDADKKQAENKNAVEPPPRVTFAKQDSVVHRNASNIAISTASTLDQPVPKLKRSDSPPRGNFRQKKF